MIKQRYQDFAQTIDQLRVVPRFILFGYCGWVMHVTDLTIHWYMRLPSAERTLEASGLAGGIITIITGLFPWIYRIYSDNANDWSRAPATKTETIVARTETK